MNAHGEDLMWICKIEGQDVTFAVILHVLFIDGTDPVGSQNSCSAVVSLIRGGFVMQVKGNQK